MGVLGEPQSKMARGKARPNKGSIQITPQPRSADDEVEPLIFGGLVAAVKWAGLGVRLDTTAFEIVAYVPPIFIDGV